MYLLAVRLKFDFLKGLTESNNSSIYSHCKFTKNHPVNSCYPDG